MKPSPAVKVCFGRLNRRRFRKDELYRCRECGALTNDPTVHAQWHAGVMVSTMERYSETAHVEHVGIPVWLLNDEDRTP